MLAAKKQYDKSSNKPSFVLGQKVFLNDPTTRKGECPKVEASMTGPFMIIDKSDDGLLCTNSDIVIRIKNNVLRCTLTD